MEGTKARVEKLKAKQAQLAEEIKKLEAREAQQSRKDDTRRKVIAGALALEHAEKNKTSDFAKKLTALLEEFVRPTDRRLFTHLDVKAKPSTATPNKAASE